MTLKQIIAFTPHPYSFAGMTMEKEVVKLTIEYIHKTVCNKMEIPESFPMNRTRERKYVLPRQLIMYLSHKHTKSSLKDIGRYFGGYDHTTVIHSEMTVRDIMETDKEVADLVESIEISLLLHKNKAA